MMRVPSLAVPAEDLLLFLLPVPDDAELVCCAQPSTAEDAAIIVPAAVVFRKSRRLSIARFIVGSFSFFRFLIG
jgi:hypothetical protein